MKLPEGYVLQRSGVCKRGDVVWNEIYGFERADGLIGDPIKNSRCCGDWKVYRKPHPSKVVAKTSTNKRVKVRKASPKPAKARAS